MDFFVIDLSQVLNYWNLVQCVSLHWICSLWSLSELLLWSYYLSISVGLILIFWKMDFGHTPINLFHPYPSGILLISIYLNLHSGAFNPTLNSFIPDDIWFSILSFSSYQTKQSWQVVARNRLVTSLYSPSLHSSQMFLHINEQVISSYE